MLKTCRTCSRLYPLWRCAHPDIFDTSPSERVCEHHKPRETPLLVDVLAKLVRETRQLAISEHWKAPPPWWREIDAALIRHQQES